MQRWLIKAWVLFVAWACRPKTIKYSAIAAGLIGLLYVPAGYDAMMNHRLEKLCQAHPRFKPMEGMGPIYVSVDDACRVKGLCPRIEYQSALYVVLSEMEMDDHCIRSKPWTPDRMVVWVYRASAGLWRNATDVFEPMPVYWDGDVRNTTPAEAEALTVAEASYPS